MKTITAPKKQKALEMYLAANADKLPPKVIADALHGKKPKADADPDDDKNHKSGSWKSTDGKYLMKDGSKGC